MQAVWKGSAIVGTLKRMQRTYGITLTIDALSVSVLVVVGLASLAVDARSVPPAVGAVTSVTCTVVQPLVEEAGLGLTVAVTGCG